MNRAVSPFPRRFLLISPAIPDRPCLLDAGTPSATRALNRSYDHGSAKAQDLADEAWFRRSADALAIPAYVEDKDSGELRRPHHVDLKTGMYRGRQILAPKKA